MPAATVGCVRTVQSMPCRIRSFPDERISWLTSTSCPQTPPSSLDRALTLIFLVGYISDVATTFHVLAEPARRRILDLLLERPRPVGELVEQLGLSQPGT